MADGFVQVATDGSGKKLQTHVNTVGADSVHAQGVTLVNTSGAPITTLPVSLASAPTTAVTGTFWQATQPVSGTFWQATQPVSLAALPSLPAGSNLIGLVEQRPALLGGTVTAATGVAATLTLAAPGASLFIYLTWLSISLTATAARTGSTALTVTTTNVPGLPVFNFGTTQAAGNSDRLDIPFGPPLKATTANTAVTIVAPVATTGIWRINAAYYTAA